MLYGSHNTLEHHHQNSHHVLSRSELGNARYDARVIVDRGIALHG